MPYASRDSSGTLYSGRDAHYSRFQVALSTNSTCTFYFLGQLFDAPMHVLECDVALNMLELGVLPFCY